jgi:hypothetical protein
LAEDRKACNQQVNLPLQQSNLKVVEESLKTLKKEGWF